MESKQCTKCKQVKLLTDFFKDKHGKFGRCSQCKACRYIIQKIWHTNNQDKVKKTDKRYRENNKEVLKERGKKHYYANKEYYTKKFKEYPLKFQDGKYHVYLLPEEHYCGQSKQPLLREKGHRVIDNRITYGLEIVGSFKTRKEAKFFESAFHALGWYGKAPKDSKFCLKTRKVA